MPSPYTRTFSARVLSVPAASATRDDPVLVVPYAANIVAVTITPQATYTGAATNNKGFALINKGLTGGDTRVAASKTFATGGDVATAFDETTIPVSGTAANVACVAGDVLALSSIQNGSGLTTPDILVKISLQA